MIAFNTGARGSWDGGRDEMRGSRTRRPTRPWTRNTRMRRAGAPPKRPHGVLDANERAPLPHHW